MTSYQTFQLTLTSLPSLSECTRLPQSTFRTLYGLLHELRGTCIDELQPLTDVISEYISRGEDLIAEQLDNMSTRSAYLNNLTQSFRTEWSDSNIENSSVLINAVSSVWIAARILLDVRAELQTVITLNCPPAYHMSPAEIDQIWNNSYLLLEAEVAGFCTSKSKVVSSPSTDPVTFSDKWVDILLENMRDHHLESHPQFDPILFIAMRLHALAGQLIVKCRYFHSCYSPRVIPSLNSILAKCPTILENFTAIEELVRNRPMCTFVQDCIPSYKHDNATIDALRKRAKQFQTQYASLSDDVERYLVICRYTKLKHHYDEVFLIRSNDDFNLIEFEEVMSEIQEMWDERLVNILSKYIQQLEFIFLCDNFHKELTKAREFLSQYECTLYQEYEIMHEHKKDINNFIFSSHWIDSRQQEKSKLLQLLKKIGEESMSDDEDSSSDCDLYDDGQVKIITRRIGSQLLRIIENDFRDFNDLHEAVRDYYEQGIEMWREFLCAVRNFDENLSKKSYLLTSGYIKFEDPSNFADSVRNLRFESADLENFADAHFKLQYHGDELCHLCEGSCQEFIQGKLGQFYDQIEEMRSQAVDAYGELSPLVPVILDIHGNIKKVEDILVETQQKIEASVEEHSQAKLDVFISYLRSRMSSLKKRTAKLSTGRSQLEPLLKIDTLDLSLLVQRYEEAELKLEKILSFLSDKLEEVILISLEKTRKLIMFGESNLDSYEPFFQSLSNEFPEKTSDVTKRLSQFKNFFNDDYFDEIQQSVDNLMEASRELVEEEVKTELVKLEESLSKLELSVRSNKILMHFVITYHELNEVLKLRETFLRSSCKPSYMADKLGLVANQIEELFGQDFKICHTYIKQLRSRYNEYLSDENQPPILPLSLEVVSRLESTMRDRLEMLELSFDSFNQTFQEIETRITQFRSDSQNILAFAEKIETAFSNKESSQIRDSSTLDTQVTTWELLLIEGQNSLSAYDVSFEHASKIYDSLSLSPKVLLVKNLFPKAKEHLNELKTCLAFFQKFQADLKVNEDRFSALTNNISHFYTEMRFPSISTNGTTSGKHEQRCREFQHEIQSIANSVRALRNALPELQAGTHQLVEYSVIEEDRLKILEDKLPEWENKISGLSQECNQMSGGYTGQLSGESGYNGQLSFDIISLTSDHDSGSFATPDEPPSEESRKIKNKLAKWKSWMKRKEKAHVMNSDISIKLSDAQLQKKEIDITKFEFEKKHRDFQALLSDRESPSTFYQKHIHMYKELELLFIHFEVSMSKRCEEVTSRVSSLLELHLLISLCEQRLMSVQTNSENAQDSQFTLEEQILKVTELRNELRDCEKDCVDKIREQYSALTNVNESPCAPLDLSSDTSTESHSESDTDEKHTSSFLSTSQTSLLLPAIPCREQIQAIETKYQELYTVVTDLINSLIAQQEKAHQISANLNNVNERIVGAINSISNESSLLNLAPELDSLKREYSSLEYSYTSMQRHYSPSRQESELQLDVKESMVKLRDVVDENTVVTCTQGNLLSPTAPVCIEFLFEPEMNQTLPPLLTEEDVPRINLPPEEAHDSEHPLTKCSTIITETLNFFQLFSSAGPHTMDSSQNLITDVQNRYTECHTDVISVLNATAGLTNSIKDQVHEWLDTTQTVRDALKGRIEERRCEWEELLEKYNTANGYVDALENDLESFKNEEWPDEAEFGNAVESSAEYLQEKIECYNEFSPRMYQLTVCDTCEDDSCQGWRDRLKIFRNKLTTIKAEFNNLLQREPLETDSFIVISPVESTPPAPSRTIETPLAEIENPHTEEISSLPITNFPKSYQLRSYGGCLETTLSFFYFLIHFLILLAVIFGTFWFRYISSANSNLKGHLPQ
eukprot:TRINITY_DN3671_c0_g1_i5.p1 TRINITY_DN3671_c0_g1~~TRINITY_DN3671_c0_g1_i5.p1  ORF type:complete len:1856 (-),score=445.08 TRINITY_DN3671_c0_g1_i5:392-5959(-)